MQVKLVLLDDVGVELVSLVFDASGSTSSDWLSIHRLISSSYDDLNNGTHEDVE